MRTRAAITTRFAMTFLVLGAAGLAALGYVLINQRLTPPIESTYTVKAVFTSANGVLGGTGQPVNVVGVPVGQVSDVTLVDGAAVVTMEIRRDDLPKVYADAGATLAPVTPLGNMQVDLVPGTPKAGPLRARTIGLAATSAPVALSELTAALDSDTRDYLAILINSVSRGVKGRGPDIQRMLGALGPSVRQAGRVSDAVSRRQVALDHFVHDLARVVRAASRDRQLADVVLAGNQTLEAIAAQDKPLRSAVAKLPGALDATRSTLANLTPFARDLGPTLAALGPSVRRLPGTIRAIGEFSTTALPVLRRDVNPLVDQARPLVRRAAPAVASLQGAAPDITGATQTLNYFLNELAYVPDAPGGRNQGFLSWFAWQAHNFASGTSTGDANGAIGRAQALFRCQGPLDSVAQPLALSQLGICPN